MTASSTITAETVNTWFGTVPIVVYPGDGGWHAMTDPWQSTYGAWGHDPETAIARLKSWAAKWMPQ